MGRVIPVFRQILPLEKIEGINLLFRSAGSMPAKLSLLWAFIRFGAAITESLILAAAREAATTERGLPITRAVIDKLKDKKLLVPAPTQLIRLAMVGRTAARRLSYRELIRGLEPSSMQLLIERAGERSLLGWMY